MQDSAHRVRFSDFHGIGYFGDGLQHIIAPIFDMRKSAQNAWTRVMTSQFFHVIFVEHMGKYEFIAYPVEIIPDQINHVLYRSFSSLDSLRKFKSVYGGVTFIKFGWHDLTKERKFDVLAQYVTVDFAEFKSANEITPGTLIEQIRKS